MLFNSKISFLIVSFFISAIFLGTSFSQQVTYLDSLDGKFALQFRITDNFCLSNFQGTILSGKYHISSRDAIRLGISLSFGSSDSETEINRLDTVKVDKSKDDLNRFDLTINTQYIRYLSVTDNVSFFGGLGPFINLFDRTLERSISENGSVVKSRSQTDGFRTGLDLLVGVEWWFNKFMSLSAEYRLQFSYRSLENKLVDDTIEGVAESSSFSISGNQVNFGITVYF
jgi:opacity protein-like surface antigen